MSTEKEKALQARLHRSPFWVCLAVFLALTVDAGLRISEQWEARRQIRVMHHGQEGSSARLAESRRIEAALQRLSVDLVQIGRTNAAAADIVSEFNIQWSGAPASPTATPPAP